MLKRFDLILREALVEKKLISEDALEPFIKEVETSDATLAQVLNRHAILPEMDILNILAEKLKISCVNLKNLSIDKTTLNKIPSKIALYYKFIPISIKDRVLTIAVSSPLEIKTQDEIRTQLGYDIDMVLACQSDMLEWFNSHYGLAADTLGKIASKTPKTDLSRREAGRENIEDIDKMADDASVIKLVNQIILEAYRKRATDIHIEPYRGGVTFRYRIDGILYGADIPAEIKNFLNAIISRIKIMSNLNIVERRLPQDGRAIVRIGEHTLDLRISTIPTLHGESMVIRILPAQMLFSLTKLGLSKYDLQIFEKLIEKPHGIIFVTGPTGSGKTTTLYACLSKLNTKARKIITIEDPVEYEIDGITQIQVMPEIGLDFARGLRSILRHDPDVIMLGEVRDYETAETAIRVALTGHLIFSTLHTNDAASGITRLIDIGVEPYLIASSVEAFIAQRLVRLICPACKIEDKAVPAELKEMISKELGVKTSEVKVHRGKGCGNCNNTGFWGRTAIYEILVADDPLKDLILKKISSNQIKKLAISRGMITLRQDGWRKVLEGLTTPEEVMNVTSAESPAPKEKDAVFHSVPSSPPEEPKDSTDPGADNRVYERLSNKVAVHFKSLKKEGLSFKKGMEPEQVYFTKNLSAGGLLFVSDESATVGSTVDLRIDLPDAGKPIECLGKVMRVEEGHTGHDYNIAVCFLDLTSAQRVRLDNYVKEPKG